MIDGRRLDFDEQGAVSDAHLRFYGPKPGSRARDSHHSVPRFSQLEFEKCLAYGLGFPALTIARASS